MAMKSSSFKPVRATEEDLKVAENKETIEEVNEQLDKDIKQAEEIEKKVEEQAVVPRFKDEDLIKDLDMDEFFFTGVISYAFKLGRNEVKMKILSSKELQEAQSYLWKLRNDDISAVEAQLKYTVAILVRAITNYNKQDLSKKTLEEKEAFINELPSMVIPVLYDDYTLLEASASKMFEKGGEGELKN